METNNKCTKCGAYHGHSPSCSLISEEYAKSELIRYHKAWQELELKHRKSLEIHNSRVQLKVNRIIKERDMWTGKFLDVKTENNALRKRLLK